MLKSKPCQYLIKLGVIAYATDMFNNAPENHIESSKSWFEGFVTGLHEASVIDDETCGELIDEMSRIVYPIE